jgi:Holliday junction resolvasome RuvABC endonuclease subunit
VRYGTFNIETKDETARISAIKNWMLSMISNWNPDCVAIEGIQF